MSYEYIKRAYGVTLVVGQRVQHEVTRKFGAVARESRSASHYAMVRFDGGNCSLPCHPLELIPVKTGDRNE